MPWRGPDDPKLCGYSAVTVLPNTRLAALVGPGVHEEPYNCNYELNPAFEAQFAASGLRINAVAENGQARGVEIPDHPFFIATLFHPQLRSVEANTAHPIIAGYLQAAGDSLTVAVH